MINIDRPIVLGSGSPRRKELLEMMKIEFEVMKSDVYEVIDEKLSPEQIVLSLGIQKATSLVDRLKGNEILITSDEIVVCEGKILGKPKDKKDAYDMLKLLSGKRQEIYTSLIVWDVRGNKRYEEVDKSYLFMKELTDREIYDYIETGDPMDKAGAYGVQTISAVFIERIEGNFYSIMGLPINRLYEILKKISEKCGVDN